MSKRSDKEKQILHDLKISPDENEENDISMAGDFGISTSNKHKNYCAAGLKHTFHGNMFQLKLLMLFLLRGIRKNYSFLLATEMVAAEQFDDVIFQYDNEKKNGIIYRFLQAKHKQDESKKIKKSDLEDIRKSAPFSLIKYFRSYIKIIRNAEFKDKNCEFKDFIICTNIDLEEELLDNFDRIKDEDDILDMKLIGKDQKRLKFKEGNFSYKEELISQITKNTTDEQINIKEEIQSFLEKLVFAVNLPKEIELGEIIENEIGEAFNSVDKKNVYSRFQQKMLDWMSKKDGEFMSHEEGKSFFKELKNEILGDIWFDIINPVTLFTGRTEELKKLHESVQRSQKGTVVSQTTTVCGLGGIGKTELVRKYAETYGTIYNNVLWINAEQNETLEQSFFELAKHNKLCIPTKDKDGKEKKIESIVMEIYDFFSKKKSLFIFDNAEKNYELNKFLPIYLSTPDANRPYILITSRIQEWEEGIEVIKLHELELSDGIEFVKKGLNIPTDDKSNDQVIEDLVKKLQCFPLAIQQAISFIEDKRVTQKYEINDYLKLYEQMDMINPKSIENDYTKVTFNTWKITIDKIQADPDTQCGQLAMKILHIASYFAPENIYRYIFLNLADDSEKLLNSAVRLLVKYSMVNGEENQSVLNIHRLVQQVTRINIKDQNKEQQIIAEAIQLLDINFPSGSYKAADYKKKRDLLPHLEIFLSHVDNLIDQKPGNKKILEKHYIASLLNWIWEVHNNFGEIHKKKVLLERCIKLNEKNYGPDHYLVDRAIEYLSKAYGQLGEHQKEIELLERVLKSLEKKYGPDDLAIARMLSKLGNRYGYLGQYQKKADLFKRVLTIDEKHHDPDNFAIVFALIGLASAYGGLSDPQKQKDFLERALKVTEMHYGPNNNEMHFGCDNYSAAKALEQIANEYGTLGNLQKQKELLERTLSVREKEYGSDHFNVANTLEDLGSVYGTLGDALKQQELLERALKINEMHYGTDNINISSTLKHLGNAYGTLGDVKKKKELLERSLTIRQKHYGLDHIEVADILKDLASVYGTLGDDRKEKELLERSLAIRQKHYGPDDIIELADTLEDLAHAYDSLGDAQKAKELLERALKINEIHYGTDHFHVAKTLEDLAMAYGDLGDSQKQTALLERALKINEMHYGSEHIYVAKTLEHLGYSYDTLADTQKQKESLERALAITENHYGFDHIDVAYILEDLGNVYCTLGDNQKEKELVERALKIKEMYYGTDNIEVTKTLEYLGNVYGTLGLHHKAYKLYEKSSVIIEQQTPLHMAARSGNLQTVEYILEKGADFLARNSHDTVLHQAVSSGKEEVILLILKNIQDRFNENSEQMYESINAKDTEGDTPLMWAAATGNINAAKILLDYGANINAADFDGQTALHEAVENGYLEFVQLLLKNYADHTLIDNNNKTPLNLAQEKFAQDLENKNLAEIVGILSAPDKNNIQQQNE